MPVQVDGEPWIQTPGDVVILKSALNVSFRTEPRRVFSFILEFSMRLALSLLQPFKTRTQ